MADPTAAEGARRPVPRSPLTPKPYDGPSRDEVLALRRRYLTPGLITMYAEPLRVHSGQRRSRSGGLKRVCWLNSSRWPARVAFAC